MVSAKLCTNIHAAEIEKIVQVQLLPLPTASLNRSLILYCVCKHVCTTRVFCVLRMNTQLAAR